MRICPKCKSEVEMDYDVCWNCQYCFSENGVLDPKHLRILCPKCNFDNDSAAKVCLNCGTQISDLLTSKFDSSDERKEIGCLRCNVPMQFQGNFKFHEGSRIGIFGNLFELFVNRESFNLYYCPQCGKIEFYLPGY